MSKINEVGITAYVAEFENDRTKNLACLAAGHINHIIKQFPGGYLIPESVQEIMIKALGTDDDHGKVSMQNSIFAN